MSDVPFVKTFDFVYGEPAPLSPRIRRVIANNPGPFTYTGSGTYLIGGEGALAVIDPGPQDESHLRALLRALGGAKVSHILITHTHLDHCGGARAFAGAVGAPILSGGAHPAEPAGKETARAEEGADLAFRPDALIRDGEIISGDGWSLECVATPGHLANHFCFALLEEGALFTGDHIMGWSTTVVAPPGGNMRDYLASLDKLLARADTIYYPTHGAPIAEPQRFVRAIRAHRHMRDAQILDQLRRGHTQIRDIVPLLYAELDPRLHGAAALNVLAHLIRMVETGAVSVKGKPELDSTYLAAS